MIEENPRPVNPADIASHYKVVYDHPDVDIRVEVDPATYPMRGANGLEQRIYDAAGKRIPRRWVKFLPGSDGQTGILMGLKDAELLFTQPAHQEKLLLNAYPQAFLRDYGHLSCNAVMSVFDRPMAEINRTFQDPAEAEDEATITNFLDEDIDAGSDNTNIEEFPTWRGDTHILAPFISAVTTQVYNELSHQVAVRAGAHDVQGCTLTAALAGTHAEDPATERKATDLMNYCVASLPHERFADKISVLDTSSALRVETVFAFNLAVAPLENRGGRY